MAITNGLMNERYLKAWNASAGWLVSRIQGLERFDLFLFLFHLDAISQGLKGTQEQLTLTCSVPGAFLLCFEAPL
jgi:hypothetical protein